MTFLPWPWLFCSFCSASDEPFLVLDFWFFGFWRNEENGEREKMPITRKMLSYLDKDFLDDSLTAQRSSKPLAPDSDTIDVISIVA